jgi:hypothetical protein
MIARIALSILIWLVGTAFQFLDGQVFRGAAILGGCAIACILLWLPLLGHRAPPVRRRGAVVAVCLNAAVAAVVAVALPGALERQRAFNLHLSRPQPILQGDFDGRRAWAVAYFQRNPGADPLQMIGEYNATSLGKQFGSFSLDEARAIAAELSRSATR